MTAFDDPNFRRSPSEWRSVLLDLLEKLGAQAHLKFTTVSDWVGQVSGKFSSSCVDIRAVVDQQTCLSVCGVLCVTVNYGESVYVSAELLQFVEGKRVRPGEFMVYQYAKERWSDCEWSLDANGEWESHSSEARWGGA